MPSFGNSSQKRLATAHELQQRLWNEVIKYIDCSIICGERTEKEQNDLYAKGRDKNGNIINRAEVVTNAKFGESTHNESPSLAVDAVPFPEMWASKSAFFKLKDIVFREWYKIPLSIRGEYELRWGGDWDKDGDYNDQKLIDYPHWEINKVLGD